MWLFAGLNALILVFIAIFEWLLPTMLRPDNLFSVTVAADTRQRPEGRALIGQWRAISLAKNGIALLIGVGLALVDDPLVATVSLAVVPLTVAFGETLLYAIFHRRARAFALPAPEALHGALLSPRRYADLVPHWWEILPLGIITGTIIMLTLLYPQLPGRYPIHWDIKGIANGFAEKSPGSAFSAVWMQLGLWVFLSLIGLSTTQARMRSSVGRGDMRRAIARFLFFIKTVLILIFGFIGIITTVSGIQQAQPGFWIVLVPIGGVVIVLAYAGILFGRMGQSGWRVAGEAGSAPAGDNTPDSAWKWGMFYYNREDRAWLVEQRAGIGMTFNFARPQGWLILGGLLALGIAVPVILTLVSRP